MPGKYFKNSASGRMSSWHSPPSSPQKKTKLADLSLCQWSWAYPCVPCDRNHKAMPIPWSKSCSQCSTMPLEGCWYKLAVLRRYPSSHALETKKCRNMSEYIILHSSATFQLDDSMKSHGFDHVPKYSGLYSECKTSANASSPSTASPASKTTKSCSVFHA